MDGKKLAQIAVHVSDDTKILVSRLADSQGMTASEYVHGLLMADIQQKRSLMETLQAAFLELDGTGGTVSRGER